MEDWQDRINDEVMEMTDEEKKTVIDSIKKRLGKSVKFTGTYQPIEMPQQSCGHTSQPVQQAQPAQILNRTGS